MPTNDQRIIIAVDFDGTLTLETDDKYPMPGDPNLPLISKLKQMRRDFNPVIIIWTCRTGSDVQYAKDFLNSYDIPYDRINKNYDDMLNFGDPKIYADIYIDDRAKTPEDFILTGLDGVRIKDDMGHDAILMEPPKVIEVLIASINPKYASQVIRDNFSFSGRKVQLEVKSSGEVYAKVPETKKASMVLQVASIDPFLEEEFKQILVKPERFVFSASGNTMKVYLAKY